MQTKNLSQLVTQNTHCRNSRPETSTSNSRLVRVKGGQDKLCAYNERRVSLKLCVTTDFVYRIQNLSRRHCNSCIFSTQIK